MTTTLDRTDPNQTVRRILPYKFQILLNGKVVIHKLNGQFLLVSRGEIENILMCDDLDVHRRRMYEAALEVLNKDVHGGAR